jgi:hypothetical protein
VPTTPRDAYAALTARVDAFFARVEQRHAADLRCAVGCDACCHARLTVTTIEADAIRDHVASLSESARANLAQIAARPDTGRCAALDDDGRCLVYDARPLVCRSHGVPIRLRPANALPVVQSCHLNFTAHGPAAADADCILDQETLSATLLTIDRLHTGDAGDTRVDLAALLTSIA